MSRLIRPLWHFTRLHRSVCTPPGFNQLLSSSIIISTKTIPPHSRTPLSSLPSSKRSLHHCSRGRTPSNSIKPPGREDVESDSDSDGNANKSRNQKKREARRAVRWGMDLAAFSSPQIKRIIEVASLEKDVFDALMLVKRMGPDVREGKRRQYNYIGKLLREVEPELMDALIQATKDGDWSRLRAFPVSEAQIIEGEDGDEESEGDENEQEEEGSHDYTELATRWFDGLISKDIKISNEVYAVRDVDFDRQELRKLVQRVHEVVKRQAGSEENEQKVEGEITAAKKCLTRFLRTLAKQIPSESSHIHF